MWVTGGFCRKRPDYDIDPSWALLLQWGTDDAIKAMCFDPNQLDQGGRIPLYFAIRRCNVIVVEKLLTLGANVFTYWRGYGNAMLMAQGRCNNRHIYFGEGDCCKVRALIHHAYHMPSRLSATAWCLHEMGGAWPDMIEPLVQERLTKTTI